MTTGWTKKGSKKPRATAQGFIPAIFFQEVQPFLFSLWLLLLSIERPLYASVSIQGTTFSWLFGKQKQANTQDRKTPTVSTW